MTTPYPRDVFIVDGARTPILKARTLPGPFSAVDLAVQAGRELLARQNFAPTELQHVVIGCGSPNENEMNIARIIALRLGCGKAVPAWTVQRNCASGMQAIDCAAKDIALGRHELVLAGGTEAMSQSTLIWNREATLWFAKLSSAKTSLDKFKLFSEFRPRFLSPIVALLKGLTDPVAGLTMGQTAENLAERFNISRQQMDQFALTSNQRVAAAQVANHFKEMVSIIANDGRVIAADDGVRPDSSLEKLASLKPVFDKNFGQITAGNSSQVSDGAALVLLASERAVKQYQLPVLGVLKDCQWAALEPEYMGLGPVFAATPIMQRHNLTMADIDFWEINEAFAAQVLACLAAWEDKTFCQKAFGMNEPLGTLDQAKLNVDGGAIAIGHPVGASGARIVLHLLHVLARNNAKQGMAAICIGGGQGGAMLVERA